MFVEVALLVTACIAIWLSTSLAIEAVEKISPYFRLSKVTLSLLVLGVVTSLPEIAVTISAFSLNAPQIAIGNVIGSQIFLLFVIIPVLAILLNGLNLELQLKNVSLTLSLLLALVPMVALYNQRLEVAEVLVILALYCTFAIIFTKKSNMIEKFTQRIQQARPDATIWEISKLVVALGILVLASNSAVREIVEISAILQTPRFLLSMIILPIATNLPELSFALGSLTAAKKDRVIGDYLGALTFNSLLLALLAVAMGGTISIGQNISLVVILFVIGISVFWLASFSKHSLSSKEGLLFLTFYILLMIAAGWQIMSAFS